MRDAAFGVPPKLTACEAGARGSKFSGGEVVVFASSGSNERAGKEFRDVAVLTGVKVSSGLESLADQLFPRLVCWNGPHELHKRPT